MQVKGGFLFKWLMGTFWMYYNEDTNTILLCEEGDLCSTLSIKDGKVYIEDIYGNNVGISQEEANLFRDALNLLRAKTQNYKKAV